MKPRYYVFTDTDDNRFDVRLTPNMMRLGVVDTRPALTGKELRRFLRICTNALAKSARAGG